MPNNVKPGFKTSEFWLVILAVIVPIINAKLGTTFESGALAEAIVNIISGISVAVLGVAYILGRVKTKVGK